MRIVGGRFRRRRLASPPDRGVRPTSDRLRETLFNVLAPTVEGARVLDAFAGTGALGLEALSRGASHVTMVERDPAALAVIRENLGRFDVAAQCTLVHGTYPDTGLAPASFDIVLLDPPYDMAGLDAVVATAGDLVAPAGRVVLEHARRHASPEAAGRLRRVRVLVSGDSALSFYSPVATEPPAPHD